MSRSVPYRSEIGGDAPIDQHAHGPGLPHTDVASARLVSPSQQTQPRAAAAIMMFTFTSTSTSRRIGVSEGHANYKWWALSCTSLGMLLAATNSGTLIIALPDLERSLHTSLLALVWVILAYLIAATVLVLMAGRLSDLFGRKRAYVGGFVVFALASLGAGFSPDATVLIGWRILQGIGSAFLFANAAALVTDAFPQGGTGPGDGREHDGRRDRARARTGARRGARGDLLALGVLVQRPVRARRRRLGRADPARAGPARTRAQL